MPVHCMPGAFRCLFPIAQRPPPGSVIFQKRFYRQILRLGLSDAEKRDLVEYLKSL